MTYSVDSSIVGYRPIRPGWRDALIAHGAVPSADGILAAYDRWCLAYHLDPNLALAQACLECTYFTSARWRTEWNPAGLGITSKTTPPNPFKTPQEGIQAHAEHICAYTYDLAECPVDHAHLKDRRHNFHLGRPTVAGLEMGPKWAVPGDTYCQHIVEIANSISDNGGPPVPSNLRLIIHAGHENIGNITADKIGQASADALRGGTGANGEQQWTPLVADALCGLLRGAGVDAVRTDAIYHGDVYGADADLVVALHYDGVGGTGRAQYCMAATVHSGPSTEAADSLADAVVATWYDTYPAKLGIAGNGPITDGMTQYYGGWYRTADTPMLLIEHCIGADGGGIRADRPTPEAAAAGDFAALAKHFGLGTAPPPPPADNKVNGHVLAGGFRALWDGTPDRLRAMGLPTSEEYDALLGTLPVTAQDFERVQMVYDISTPDPFRVRVPLRTERVKRVAKTANKA